MDQIVPIGSNSQSVNLYGLSDGTTITASSSDISVIPHPAVSAVNNGSAILSYKPVANKDGVIKITLTISGTGYTDLTIPFDITISKNNAPTIAQIADVAVGSAKQNTVNLADIYDGNTEVEQVMAITATSSDQSVIKDSQIGIDYGVKSSTHGVLTFTSESVSSGSKTAVITVNVMDNGGTLNGGLNTKTTTFNVTVYPQYYNPPTLNAVADNFFAIIGVTQTAQITGISDGNGGKNIGGVTAAIVSATGQSVTVNPVVNYIPGSDNATITYTASQLGSSQILITVTNAGAPANSNGNTSATKIFVVKSIEAPIIGYIEDFSASDILGADYYTTQSINTQQWATDLINYPQKWYIEGQGNEQTLTLDPANKKAILAVNKPSSIPKTFAGTWFSPRKFFDLSSNKYLSVKVSASPPTKVAFDIFDVHFKRYGQLVPQNVNGTPKVFTFVFNGTPTDKDLDFSKIATILLNVSNLTDYNGVVTISDLKIGNLADNAPPASIPVVAMDLIGNRNLFTNGLDQKIDITGIYVVKEGLKNDSPVSLSISSSNTSLIPTPTVTAVSDGKASIAYKPVAGKQGIDTITVTATAAGATAKIIKFAIDVKDKNLSSAASITYDQATTHQTITGLGTNVADIENTVGDLGSSWLRFFWGINQGSVGLENSNDNDDPNVLDLSKFKHDPQVIKDVLKAKDKDPNIKIFVSVFSPPYWMKENLSEEVPFFANNDNVLDPHYYDEFVEWVVGSTLKFKEETGLDLFAVSPQNEPQFPEFYASCQYTADQLKEVSKLIGLKFKALGIPTKVCHGEILPAQGQVLDFFQAVNNDAITKDVVGAFATHNYDRDGIATGGAGATEWASYFVEAQRVDPKKELWMTETSGHSPTVAGGMDIAGNLFNALNYGNINGWDYLSLTKEVSGIGYYVQKNFFKYIRPGAVRTDIASSDANVLALSFKHAENKTVSIVLINRDVNAKQVKLDGTGLPSKMYVYQTAEGINTELVDSVSNTGSYLTLLPANSVTTLYNIKVGEVTDTEPKLTSSEEHIFVYPNPATEEVNIALPESGTFKRVTLIDLLGRPIREISLPLDHKSIINIDLRGLPLGLYILSVDGKSFKILLK